MSLGYGGIIKRILTTIGESDPTKPIYLSQLFHKKRYRALVTIIQTLSKNYVKSLLDVGCGKGFLYQALTEYGVNVEQYICLDIDCKKLGIAKEVSVCADAQNMPIAPCSVDYSVASEVLEHLKKPFTALKHMITVTRRYLIITFPDERIKDALGFKYPEHITRLNIHEVTSLVEHHGFKRILHYRLKFLIPPSVYDKFLPYNERILRFLEAFQKAFNVIGYLSMIKTEILVFERVKGCQHP